MLRGEVLCAQRWHQLRRSNLSYQTIDQLTKDYSFIGRVTAATTEQAGVYMNDGRANWVSLAEDVLKGEEGPINAFVRIAASGPGIGDKVDSGDGTINQGLVTDGDILSLVQANWQVVVELFHPTPPPPDPPDVPDPPDPPDIPDPPVINPDPMPEPKN